MFPRHDIPRPRSQNLCLVKSIPLLAAAPVEPVIETPTEYLNQSWESGVVMPIKG